MRWDGRGVVGNLVGLDSFYLGKGTYEEGQVELHMVR